ncbi:AMP-binding protein [Rhodobacteraceae bacterium NNCM2]|nr:AMP-binding protein [Coraliihabitans acroporae]
MTGDLNFSSLLAHSDAASRVAVIHDDQQDSFADLDLYARKVAAWLTDNGVSKGDKVAVWLVNKIEWLGLLFGAGRIGATIVSVNTRYRAYELEYLLKKSGASMLIMQPGFRKIDFAGLAQEVDPANLPDLKSVAVVCHESEDLPVVLGYQTVRFDANGFVPVPADTNADPEAPLILFTTSGTTSGPKLVMHNARSLVLHSRRVAINEGMDQPGARVLASLPLCGVFSLNAVLGGLAGGAAVILMETFDAPGFVDLFVRHDVTNAYGSDEMYDFIAAQTVGANPLPTARRLGFSTFHPGLDAFVARMRAKNFPMVGLYGSSEVNALFALQKMDASDAERFAAGGYPVSGADVDIRVRDGESGELLAPGETGEIEIRGQTNFSGYLDDPAATAKAMTDDGYFKTGDIGHMRKDGSFVYEGRGGDALRLGGFLVSPTEIESAIKLIDGVENVQVVGVEVDGKSKAAAFVIPAAGADPDPEALRVQMKQSVAAFKVPSWLWLIDAFPVTESANGTKIQRTRLRQMAMERIACESDKETSL